MQSFNIVEYARQAVKEHPEVFEALLEYERTGKLRKPNPKKRANFTIDAKLLRVYRQWCKKQSYSMSARIEKFIGSEVEER